MKLASLGLGIAASIILVALLFAWVSGDVLAYRRAEPAPDSGMALIDGFTCHRAETKRVVVRGVEDNFSSQGDEHARPHDRLAGRNINLMLGAARFDDPTPDHGVTDYFEFSPATASGLIVMKIRPPVENNNDVLAIGDLTTQEVGDQRGDADLRMGLLSHHIASGHWKRAGDLWWASIADIPLTSGRSLLEAINASDGRRVIDIHIADDTVVDFVAAVSCESPRTDSGVTLRHVEAEKGAALDIAIFSSQRGDPANPAEHEANPFVGDERCSIPLPLLCFADRDTRPPRLASAREMDLARHWNGGELAATAPVRGDAFSTITEADNHCTARFGQGWRTAEWGDGGFMGSFAGQARGRRFAGRHWVDIRGQPYATCWRRADGSR